MRLRREAKIGAEADVPPDCEKSSPKKTGMLSPFAETSGMLFEESEN